MTATTIDISVAELERLLDGGEDDDWYALVKAKIANGCVRIVAHHVDGSLCWDHVLAVGDSVTFHWTFRITG